MHFSFCCQTLYGLRRTIVFAAWRGSQGCSRGYFNTSGEGVNRYFNGSNPLREYAKARTERRVPHFSPIVLVLLLTLGSNPLAVLGLSHRGFAHANFSLSHVIPEICLKGPLLAGTCHRHVPTHLSLFPFLLVFLLTLGSNPLAKICEEGVSAGYPLFAYGA